MLKTIMTAGFLLAAGAGAQAATTWNLSGTITPAPCALSLVGTNTADFGTLTSETVKSWLPLLQNPQRYSGVQSKYSKTLTLSVVCNTASRFALHFLDNSPTTVAGPTNEITSFGMGKYTDPKTSIATNTGRYVVKYDQLTITPPSGPAVLPGSVLMVPGLASATNHTWSTLQPVEKTFIASGRSIGYRIASSGAVMQPDALLGVSGALEFFLEPLAAVVEGATSTIPLTGSATITLVAL